MTFAYLDIETSWEKTITIIGIYRSGEGTTQLIAPDINRENLLQALEGAERLFTYNGSGIRSSGDPAMAGDRSGQPRPAPGPHV